MARDESPPFGRGETFYNGGTIDSADLGGVNLEGREYVFEVNAQNDSTTKKDTSGRQVRVKVVRNVSGVALKPARLVKFSAASTAPYETQSDGYCTQVADRPAGIVDEFLPSAGVPNNDLFYIVIDGPSKCTQGATTAATATIGLKLVPAAYGATAGDDLGGRADLQSLSGATTTLGNQIQHAFGVAATANSTAGNTYDVVVHRYSKV